MMGEFHVWRTWRTWRSASVVVALGIVVASACAPPVVTSSPSVDASNPRAQVDATTDHPSAVADTRVVSVDRAPPVEEGLLGALRGGPFDIPVFNVWSDQASDPARTILLEPDGFLWTNGLIITGYEPRRDVSYGSLSGFTPRGDLACQVPYIGLSYVESMASVDQGVVIVGRYRGAGALGHAPLTALPENVNGRFVARVDRRGRVLWARSLGVVSSLDVAARGTHVELLLGVRPGEDTGGILPPEALILSNETVVRWWRVSLGDQGEPQRVIPLQGLSRNPSLDDVALDPEGRLTALLSHPTTAVSWNDDGSVRWHTAFNGVAALDANARVGILGRMSSRGRCGVLLPGEEPPDDRASRCLEVLVDGNHARTEEHGIPDYTSIPVTTYNPGQEVSYGVLGTSLGFLITVTRQSIPPEHPCRYNNVELPTPWRSAYLLHDRTDSLVEWPTDWMTIGAGKACRIEMPGFRPSSGGIYNGPPPTFLRCVVDPNAPPTPSWVQRCEGRTTDIAFDMQNCGACGHRCEQRDGVAMVCHYARCVAVGCDATRANCDGNFQNGCEVDLSGDPSHCGTCGRSCAPGATCVGGTCCVGSSCEGPFPSTGAEGDLRPTHDITLPTGRHDYRSVLIPAGVTLRVSDGSTLDLRATQGVQILGTIDLRGARGAALSPEQSSRSLPECDPFRPPDGNGQPLDSFNFGVQEEGECDPFRPCELWRRLGWPSYEDNVTLTCARCRSWRGCSASTGWSAPRAQSGVIGDDAVRDRAVRTTFRPGGNGGADCAFLTRALGARGGGAVRISSAEEIVVGVNGAVLADGGSGTSPEGVRVSPGPGSGGVVVLSAPRVSVARNARISALGGESQAGLGRIHVSTNPSRCALDGQFAPPLRSGCTPTREDESLQATHVTAWPY